VAHPSLLKLTGRRLLAALAVMVLVVYFSLLMQEMALRAQQQQAAPWGEVLVQAARETWQFGSAISRGDLGNAPRPSSPFGSERAISQLLYGWILNSLGLLLLAMLVGGVVGGLIGGIAAALRRPGVSLAAILLSIIGISTPSFFLGMLLQWAEIMLYRTTGVRLVPVGGFGWDAHLVLPVLVLAARPIAQVARLSFVRISTILEEDYVRTAHAKGLYDRIVWLVHVSPNALNAVLTAIGTSLRFSLSSLPVVEYMFGWPGAGKALLELLRGGQRSGATVLVLTMGAFFLVVNLLLDVVYPLIDPRLRQAELAPHLSNAVWDWLVAVFGDLRGRLTLRRWRKTDLPRPGALLPQDSAAAPSTREEDDAQMSRARKRARARAIAGNPALLLGAVLGLALLAIVVVGPRLAPHDAYITSPMIEIDGRLVKPPVGPMPQFLLGTDAQGRDILSLLLTGARRTLSIALLAVLARLLFGGAMGFLAGWFSGSALDRAIMAAAEVLAAFPSLLLAMLVVYAIGIRQGMTAFVVALACVGWGEVMQTVRSQVLSIKPMAYIESAVSAGLTEGQILSAHVLPNVWPTMVSLAFLEMGGVLMLLGELGFLGVFIGGGLAADGEGLPTLVYYDVPEWSVMLANSWRQFRSFPWATLYPALAFFVAILGFTFLGEGLRRLTERLTLSFRTLFNRYTLATAAIVFAGAHWMFQSTGFVSRYAPSAQSLNVQRAMDDINYLASENVNGRLSGSPDADRVAEWIAEQFASQGLQPGGEDNTFFQTFQDHYRDLVGVPRLVFHGPEGQTIEGEYGRDWIRDVGPYEVGGSGGGPVIIVASAPDYVYTIGVAAAELGITVEEYQRRDRIVLYLNQDSREDLQSIGRAGQLTMRSAPLQGDRYYLLAQSQRSTGQTYPTADVSRDLVQRLLSGGPHDLAELEKKSRHLEQGQGLYLDTGWTAELQVPAERREGVSVRNVIGYWPGEDVALDSEAIIVSAYYDGLGSSPDGTLYPGANDNASGVAALLETLRTLKDQGFRPKRTILFVAWIGGERSRAVDYTYFMRAHPAFAEAYTVVAGLELEGVGSGSGSTAVLKRASRERLTRVVQQAARAVRCPLSTREPGLHDEQSPGSTVVRPVPSLTISWSGSDLLAHTVGDTAESIDPSKVGHVGRLVTLSLMVLSNDPAY